MHGSRRQRAVCARPARFGRYGAVVATQGEASPAEEREVAEWSAILAALCAYKAVYGDLRVPTRFIVPSDDARFPDECHALKLGMRVAAIRSTGRFVNQDESRRRALESMGFEWRLRRSQDLLQPGPGDFEPYETILGALRVYKTVNGDLRVGPTFVVPHVDEWPVAMHGLPLGARVRTLSGPRGEEDLHPYLDTGKFGPAAVSERITELTQLGLEWIPFVESKGERSSTARRFDVVYEALVAFRAYHGHIVVPPNFVVPSEHPWPLAAWDLKLGNRVTAMRSHGTFLKNQPKRRAMLLELGFAFSAKVDEAAAAEAAQASAWTVRDEAQVNGTGEDEEDDEWSSSERGRPQQRLVPISIDFADELEFSKADQRQVAEHGWVFEEFDDGFLFDDVVEAIVEYTRRFGSTAVPLDYVTPHAADEDEDEDEEGMDEEATDVTSSGAGNALDAALAAFLAPVDGDEATLEDAAVLAQTSQPGAATAAAALEDDLDEELLDDELLDAPAPLEEEEKDESEDEDALFAGPPVGGADGEEEPSLDDLLALEDEEEAAARSAANIDAQFGAWPASLRGLKLGAAVDGLKVGDVLAFEDEGRRAVLDAIDFDWGLPDEYIRGVQWNAFLACLYSFSKIKGSFAVHWDFVMPFEEPWPLPLRGSKLGRMVNEVRDQLPTLLEHFPERKRFLDLMGFMWLPPIFEEPAEVFDERLPPCLRLTSAELDPAYAKRRRKKRTAPLPGADETGANYNSFTIKELKEILRARVLPLSGRVKSDYIARLEEHDVLLIEERAAAAEAAALEEEGAEDAQDEPDDAPPDDATVDATEQDASADAE